MECQQKSYKIFLRSSQFCGDAQILEQSRSAAHSPDVSRYTRLHARRSHRAGSLQASLPFHRRRDGRCAAPHRIFAQHQGASRLFLRALRPLRAKCWPWAITCRCTWARCRCRCALRSTNSTLAPGDVAMLNDPFRGGTHLPDITVVAPVFVARKGTHVCRCARYAAKCHWAA